MIMLIEDIPVYDISQDSLGRKSLVGLIVNAIKEKVKANHSAMAIGIYGVWGEGKTSLMRMVQTQLEKDAQSTVWYNPWSVREEGKLLMEFFSILSNFAFEDEDTLYAIENYGNCFYSAGVGGVYSPVIASYQTKLAQCIPSVGKDVAELKGIISKKLKEKGNHPIIFIDDADRLSSEEINTVFKLVRQIADFDNVIYVIGIDPAAVSDALDEGYGGKTGTGKSSKGRSYLEKIIQVPIVLPSIQEATLQHRIDETLEEIAGEFDITLDKKYRVLVSETIFPVFTSLRSIIRYGNQLRFVLPEIYQETEFVDLCLMEALKYLNEQGWLEIYKQKSNLLGEGIFYPSEEEREKARKESFEKAMNAILEQYPSESRAFVDDILRNHLFTTIHHYKADTLSKSVNNPIYFGQYFVGGVPEGIIPRHDAVMFAELVKNDQEKAISWINEKMKGYPVGEIERTARLTLEMVQRSESSIMAGKLCRVLSYSEMAKDYSKYLVSNPTSVDATITAWIIPQYMVRYEDGMRIPETKTEAEYLKELYGKAPLNFCLCVFYGVYSDHCFLPDDEKGVFDVLKDRVLKEDELAILGYSPFTVQQFLRVWKKLDQAEYAKYLEKVLKNDGFCAGEFVVRCIEAAGTDKQLTIIASLTYLFADVWELFKQELGKYADKENKNYKLFVFNSDGFKREWINSEEEGAVRQE